MRPSPPSSAATTATRTYRPLAVLTCTWPARFPHVCRTNRVLARHQHVIKHSDYGATYPSQLGRADVHTVSTVSTLPSRLPHESCAHVTRHRCVVVGAQVPPPGRVLDLHGRHEQPSAVLMCTRSARFPHVYRANRALTRHQHVIMWWRAGTSEGHPPFAGVGAHVGTHQSKSFYPPASGFDDGCAVEVSLFACLPRPWSGRPLQVGGVTSAAKLHSSTTRAVSL